MSSFLKIDGTICGLVICKKISSKIVTMLLHAVWKYEINMRYEWDPGSSQSFYVQYAFSLNLSWWRCVEQISWEQPSQIHTAQLLVDVWASSERNLTHLAHLTDLAHFTNLTHLAHAHVTLVTPTSHPTRFKCKEKSRIYFSCLHGWWNSELISDIWHTHLRLCNHKNFHERQTTW